MGYNFFNFNNFLTRESSVDKWISNSQILDKKQFLKFLARINLDLYDWNYAARPERAEALSPGQHPGLLCSQILLSAKHSDLKFDLLICRTADYIHVYPHVYRRKTVYWVVIRQIGGLFNQHNATNSKSFTGQLLYLLDYRAYTWQITAKSRTNVHLADNNKIKCISNRFVHEFWI